MTKVYKASANSSIEHVVSILERDGCIVIEGLLEDQETKHLQTEIQKNFDQIPVCKGEFFGYSTKRMSGVLAKSVVSRDMAVHPMLLQIMDYFLLQSSREYQLNLTQAIQIHPGEPAQIVHTDELLFPFDHPGKQAMINCMWAVDDFTMQNGATHLVPGSHKWPQDRQPTPDEITQGEMSAGSVLIYFGGLLHAGGANISEAPRTGLVISYCLGWLRQAENHYLALPRDLVKTFPKRLQRLLGYFVHAPNLGCVEGQDPMMLLDETLSVNGEFKEFMPEEIIPVLKEHRKNSNVEKIFNSREAYEKRTG